MPSTNGGDLMPWFLVSTPEYDTDDGQNEPLRVTRDSVEVEAVDEESARFLGAIALHEEESQWLRDECEGRIHASDLEVSWMGEECACEHPQGDHEPRNDSDDELALPMGPCTHLDCDCVAFEAPSTAVAAA